MFEWEIQRISGGVLKNETYIYLCDRVPQDALHVDRHDHDPLHGLAHPSCPGRGRDRDLLDHAHDWPDCDCDHHVLLVCHSRAHGGRHGGRRAEASKPGKSGVGVIASSDGEWGNGPVVDVCRRQHHSARLPMGAYEPTGAV